MYILRRKEKRSLQKRKGIEGCRNGTGKVARVKVVG